MARLWALKKSSRPAIYALQIYRFSCAGKISPRFLAYIAMENFTNINILSFRISKKSFSQISNFQSDNLQNFTVT